jgi:RNA polymerase sigma factor (sigma-70 family)
MENKLTDLVLEYQTNKSGKVFEAILTILKPFIKNKVRKIYIKSNKGYLYPNSDRQDLKRDIEQDLIIKILQLVKSVEIREEIPFENYLNKSLKNWLPCEMRKNDPTILKSDTITENEEGEEESIIDKICASASLDSVAVEELFTEELTEEEKKIINLLNEGYSQEEVAEKLNIGRQRISEKLKVIRKKY